MNSKTPDEKQKNATAKRVTTPKRKYFLPFQQVSMDAVDLADVEKQLKKKELEVGDGNN
jgi:hypothetical protein